MSLETPAPQRSQVSHSSVISDTPIKQNMASTNVFFKGNLEQQKEAVRTDLGPVPEVSVDFMLKYIVPTINVDLEATMDALEADNAWSESKGWSAFGQLSPRELGQKKNTSTKSRNDKETEVFRRMKTVYDTIVECAQFGGVHPNPTLSFEQLPNHAPNSDTDVKTRPDGIGLLNDDQAIRSTHACPARPTNQRRSNVVIGKPNWFDIAYVEEYKLDDKVEDVNDNIWKILWSLHHIMHVDHRRRFAFGVTIENQNTRIWFCCRQIVLVSQTFDFRQDARKLVHLIVSLAYASPVQLGYDPTMTLKWRNGGWHYDIELTTKLSDGIFRTEIYQTQRVIADSAYNIRGRATRVYEAINKGRRVAIKDSWIDTGRPKEGDTLADLLEGATDVQKKNFLTVVQHGIVQINGQDDSTHALILKKQCFDDPDDTDKQDRQQLKRTDLDPLFQRQFSRLGYELGTDSDAMPEEPTTRTIRFFALYHYAATKASNSSSAAKKATASMSLSSRGVTSEGLPHQTPRLIVKPIIYSPKDHYRIAFEEVGESLMAMADAGRLRTTTVFYVLRDIIKALKYMAEKGYVHRDVSAGNILIYKHCSILADLEFAKEYGVAQSSYVRTGTYSFMAGEVARGQYTHQPNFKPFAHNPVHDLESLWWVVVWCMIWHYPVPEDSALPEAKHNHVAQMKEHGMKLFPSYHTWDKTRLLEIDSHQLYARRANGYNDPPITAIHLRLDHIRQCISWAHQATQKSLPRSASYFTEDLLVADPYHISIQQEKLNLPQINRLPVYDMIMAKVKARVADLSYPDRCLWPLDSIAQHSEWLRTKRLPVHLPRSQASGPVNMDYEENYYDN